ncbi:hypothetical protein QFC22_002821 [Naganishia vaughanmartiniae]|uniref:Uncharacterized protein n=1 Tax=Naganishia vaughanmartiniae TaxID=1424756 RepID=A0ACC2XBZ3_9TREE|nr:hypothetical protein QFC22_002821 [Naganishia vaughanmartiniae]
MSGAAEEYELPRTSFGHHRRQPSGGVNNRKRVTLHTGPPAGEDLQQQTINGDPGPSTLRNRSSHVTLDPISPGAKPQIMRQTDLFLTEDPTTSPFPRGRDEVVDIPDFGGMLGLTNGEGQEDNYVRAQGFRSPWKRRLFLLMEEPGSSGEAFVVHVVCTGSIVARCSGPRRRKERSDIVRGGDGHAVV